MASSFALNKLADEEIALQRERLYCVLDRIDEEGGPLSSLDFFDDIEFLGDFPELRAAMLSIGMAHDHYKRVIRSEKALLGIDVVAEETPDEDEDDDDF